MTSTYGYGLVNLLSAMDKTKRDRVPVDGGEVLLGSLCCKAFKKLDIQSKVRMIRRKYRRTLRLLRARRMARNQKRKNAKLLQTGEVPR